MTRLVRVHEEQICRECDHTINVTINVLQNGRTDLDIGLSVMDDDNYHRWLARQPSSAFLIAHRFKYGTMTFMPSDVGLYHVVLDNRYSVFTGKQVNFSIYEIWLEEKELVCRFLRNQKKESENRK